MTHHVTTALDTFYVPISPPPPPPKLLLVTALGFTPTSEASRDGGVDLLAQDLFILPPPHR